MATPSPDHCPSCGAARLANAPRGLCPRCLLRQGLDSDPPGSSPAAEVGTKVARPGPSGAGDTLAATDAPVSRVVLRDTEAGSEPPVHRTVAGEPPAPADVSARLCLLGEIARGGMGTVLKGHDGDLGRDVAVKILLETHRDRPDLVRRFFEEAQIAGQLQHPGIVPVYDMGVLGDRRPYFTMKLVRGRTLAEMLRDREAPGRELPGLLAIYEAICQTVAYAHARGVIHRDLKPSNVMVGGFGEVQVMDWGLAKVLPGDGAVGDAAAGKATVQEIVIVTARNGRGEPDSDLSRAGSVMGTPAYMAPEQARGEVGRVDERADVFALGSMLCEVLTGQPAYTGQVSAEIQHRAARGDVADALGRLDGCGADADLIDLARACLAPEPDDRPRAATAVAARLTAYRQGVQERLRAAELGRATEAARAEEARHTAEAERRARRLTAALAAAVVGLVALGGGGYGWALHQRAERRARTAGIVAEALTEADRLCGAARATPGEGGPWAEALAAARRAEGLLAQGEAGDLLRLRVAERVAALVRERDAAEADRRLLAALESIRGGRAEHGNAARTDADYAAAFRAAGLDLDALAAEAAGAWISGRGEPVELTSYLDNWASVRRAAGRPAADWRHLVAAARAADPDPWRDALRARIATQDKAADFRTLADDAAALDAQPAESLVLLALQLRHAIGDPTRAEAVLRRAWRRYPGDFWVNFDLARAPGRLSGTLRERFPRPVEAVRHLTAAVAIRPGSAMAHTRLGRALLAAGDRPGAIAEHREAIRLRPDDAMAHISLGDALLAAGDRPGAIAEHRKAVRLRPDLGQAHVGLGRALRAAGDLPGAIAEHREAVRLQPGSSLVHLGLGRALLAAGDLPGALAESREAIRLRPDLGDAHAALGAALLAAGDLPGAIAECREAIRLEPDDAVAHAALGAALLAAGDLPGAIAECRKTIRLKPDDPVAHTSLGAALLAARDRPGAIAEYREAIRLRPDLREAHAYLGAALLASRDLPGAMAAFREAIRLQPGKAVAHASPSPAPTVLGGEPPATAASGELIRSRPDDAQPHNGRGLARAQRGDLDAAIAKHREALRLAPQRATLHNDYGTTLRHKGDLEGAIAEYREAIRLQPSLASAHVNLNDALLASGGLPSTIAADREAIRIMPGDAQAHTRLGLALRAAGDFPGAVAALREAIRLVPGLALAHNELGLALRDQGDLDAAIAEHREALRLAPGFAYYKHSYGLALRRKGDIEGVIAVYREAIRRRSGDAEAHCELGRALRANGRYAEALAELRIGDELGSRWAEWRYPSARWTATAKQLVQLGKRLPPLLRGDAKPADNAERLALAEVCDDTRRFAAAARLRGEAMAADPKLADDRRAGHRYDAACAAALAAAGKGEHEPALDDAAKAALRQQALDWLKAELAAWSRALDSENRETRATVAWTLCHWRSDPGLAGIREPKALDALPDDEPAAWRAFWSQVEALRAKAVEGAP